MIPTAAGYVWKHCSIDGFNHQYPVEAPGADGILEAKCEKLAVVTRVSPEPRGPYCPECLKRSPGHQLADRMEARSRLIAAEQCQP
jgi:hypothetical protein